MNEKVISVSRRTDIPAFYGQWFMNALKRGYVDSYNPFNRKYVSRVSLNKDDVICFVFWSKNPKPFIKYLDELDQLGFTYYFQFTITPYDNDIETCIPSKTELINTFIELSLKIGKDKVIWRYDPIIITDKYDVNYHKKQFEFFASKLAKYTNKVVISFVDFYKKTINKNKNLIYIDLDMQLELGKIIANIALKYNLEVASCGETIDLSVYGIKHNKCIDDELINAITSKDVNLKKDKGQRKECNCVESIDIGSSRSCKHFCTYCYANTSEKQVKKNIKLHDPASTLLIGKLKGDEMIYYRNGEKSLLK